MTSPQNTVRIPLDTNIPLDTMSITLDTVSMPLKYCEQVSWFLSTLLVICEHTSRCTWWCILRSILVGQIIIVVECPVKYFKWLMWDWTGMTKLPHSGWDRSKEYSLVNYFSPPPRRASVDGFCSQQGRTDYIHEASFSVIFYLADWIQSSL